MLLDDACFDAQQAAEKAPKAVFVAKQLPFPKTHDIALLVTLLEHSGQPVPDPVRAADALTPYATESRYPAFSADVTPEEHLAAVHLAEAVVAWAEGAIGAGRGTSSPSSAG